MIKINKTNKKTILIENEIFFERLKECRTKAGLTQTELSLMLGVGSTTIYRYEHKEIKRINIDLLNNISKVLNVNAEYLLGKSDDCNCSFKGKNHTLSSSDCFFTDLGIINRVENLNGLQTTKSKNFLNTVRSNYFNYLLSQLSDKDFFKVLNFTENLIAENKSENESERQQEFTQSNNQYNVCTPNFKSAEELSKEKPYAAFGGIYLSKQDLQSILKIINKNNQNNQSDTSNDIFKEK